jgi:hypothetical protein
MAESKVISVRLTSGVSAQNVEIDLKTATDSDLKFLWEVIKNEDAREELKLRTGMDPAKKSLSCAPAWTQQKTYSTRLGKI